MADLGSDLWCVDDLDPGLRVVSGKLGVAQAVARRWLSRTGDLFYDRSYGSVSVEDFVNAPVTPFQAAAQLQAEALKDERVDDCGVSTELAGDTFTISGRFDTAEGPFSLTLAINAVTAEVLALNT